MGVVFQKGHLCTCRGRVLIKSIPFEYVSTRSPRLGFVVYHMHANSHPVPFHIAGCLQQHSVKGALAVYSCAHCSVQRRELPKETHSKVARTARSNWKYTCASLCSALRLFATSPLCYVHCCIHILWVHVLTVVIRDSVLQRHHDNIAGGALAAPRCLPGTVSTPSSASVARLSVLQPKT